MINVENRTLFHGDNLSLLRGINSNSIHLIATDPPFNKSKDFHATPDSLAAGAKFQDRWSWEKDVHSEWVDQITDDFPKLMEAIESARYAHSDGMGAFMCFMAVRLLEMRRVLRKDGSIYLHCDPTASHYLKAIMDAIFGKTNFRNEIIWAYKTGGVSKHWFGRKHDVILFYSKSKQWTFNPLQEKNYLTHKYGFSTISVKVDEKGPYKMAHLRDVWDIGALVGVGSERERTGYPTQKPLALYERIIQASSNKGEIILDPFCGCATTLVAAERLGRRWVGMDIWEKAHEVVIERLKRDGLTGPDGEKSVLFSSGQIIYSKELPERTDDGLLAAPDLKTINKERHVEPPLRPGEPKTRQEIIKYLQEKVGQRCQGCDRHFDDPRYLELDHNTPRSQGGLNHFSNRLLLCSPCNRAKSNTLTLEGLRRLNKREGWMVK